MYMIRHTDTCCSCAVPAVSWPCGISRAGVSISFNTYTHTLCLTVCVKQIVVYGSTFAQKAQKTIPDGG